MKTIFLASAMFLSLKAMAFEASLKGKVYVANEEAGTISIIDMGSNSVLKTLDTMKTHGAEMTMFMAHNVQVAPNGKTVWLTAVAMSDEEHGVLGGGHEGESSKADEIIVIDSSTDQIVKRIPLGADLHLAHVVLDNSSEFAFVTATNSDEVFQIDAKKFKVVRKYKLKKGAGPHGARICADKMFVAGMNGKSLGIIDLKDGAIIEVPVGGVSVQTACLKDGTAAFVSLYDTKEIVRYDIVSKLLTRSPLPSESQGPAQITISPDETKLLIADQGVLMDRPSSNLLYEMNPQTLKIQETYKVGDGAHGIAIDKTGRFAFVTSQSDSKMTMVDLQEKQVVSDLEVGKKPNGISVLD